jgi:hypothetical protein
MNLHERLLNWSYYVTLWLEDPTPKRQKTCASAEKHYNPELGHVMDDEDYPDMPSINWNDGEFIESLMRELPDHLRIALKAYYVQFPYCSNHIIAHNLRTSVKKFERDLEDAKARLQKHINKVSRNKIM